MNGSRPAQPTIYDVARRAGVSKSLVSLVMHDSPKVSLAKRAAVQAAIRDLGYRPSRQATELAGSRTRTVAVVVPDFANPWFVDMLAGMRAVLDEHGFLVAVADCPAGSAPIEAFWAQRVDGMVIGALPAPDSPPPAGVPIVLAGSDSRGTDVDTVVVDDRAGAALVVEHLAGLGHRRIGHVTGPSAAATSREAGFEAAAATAGLDFMTLSGPELTEPEGYRLTSRLLAERPDLTAVFTANDAMAVGAVAAARDAGLDVPLDLSIVGFDDAPIAGSRLASLTTIDGRNREIGERSARAVLSRLADPSRPDLHELVQPLLVVRGSSGPARG